MHYRYHYPSPKNWLLAILILAILIFAAGRLSAQTHHYKYGGSSSASAIQLYNLAASEYAPGDTVHLKGHYTLINQAGFNGTASQPVIFIVDSGIRVGSNTSNAYGIRIAANYWKFLGSDTNTTVIYNESRVMTNNFNVDTSRYFVVSNVKMIRAAAGFFGNPSTGGNRGWWVLENFSISNTEVVNPDDSTSEAAYRGPTSEVDTTRTFWDSAIIRNGVMYNLAGDGLQVALHRNVLIENVHVYNYGQRNFTNQRAAFVIGGSSDGIVRNCTVNGGTGPYFQTFGYGDLYIQNCNFINGAMTTTPGETGGPDGIYLQKNGNAALPLNVYIENTTVGQALRNAIRETNATAVYLCNNNLTSNGTLLDGNVFSTYVCGDPPPPVWFPSFRLKLRKAKISNSIKKLYNQ